MQKRIAPNAIKIAKKNSRVNRESIPSWLSQSTCLVWFIVHKMDKCTFICSVLWYAPLSLDPNIKFQQTFWGLLASCYSSIFTSDASLWNWNTKHENTFSFLVLEIYLVKFILLYYVILWVKSSWCHCEPSIFYVIALVKVVLPLKDRLLAI